VLVDDSQTRFTYLIQSLRENVVY